MQTHSNTTNYVDNISEDYNNLIVDVSYGSDTQIEHRVSCHKCGNIRVMHKLCEHCPQAYCLKCSEKMVKEFGKECFINGCPLCKELCCCSTKSIDCPLMEHCYKRCPKTKCFSPRTKGTKSSDSSPVSHGNTTITYNENMVLSNDYIDQFCSFAFPKNAVVENTKIVKKKKLQYVGTRSNKSANNDNNKKQNKSNNKSSKSVMEDLKLNNEVTSLNNQRLGLETGNLLQKLNGKVNNTICGPYFFQPSYDCLDKSPSLEFLFKQDLSINGDSILNKNINAQLELINSQYNHLINSPIMDSNHIRLNDPFSKSYSDEYNLTIGHDNDYSDIVNFNSSLDPIGPINDEIIPLDISDHYDNLSQESTRLMYPAFEYNHVSGERNLKDTNYKSNDMEISPKSSDLSLKGMDNLFTPSTELNSLDGIQISSTSTYIPSISSVEMMEPRDFISSPVRDFLVACMDSSTTMTHNETATGSPVLVPYRDFGYAETANLTPSASIKNDRSQSLTPSIMNDA